MAGVKGRSGRRPLREEERRLKIIDKAWTIVEQNLDDPDMPMAQKLKYAILIILKDMPQQVEGMENNQSVVIMTEVKKGDEPIRYDIGTPDPENNGNSDASEDIGYPQETPAPG